MTEEEICRARKLIEKIRPDSRWRPEVCVGDLRELIFFLGRAISEIEEARKQEIRKVQCHFDLGEDWA